MYVKEDVFIEELITYLNGQYSVKDLLHLKIKSPLLDLSIKEDGKQAPIYGAGKKSTIDKVTSIVGLNNKANSRKEVSLHIDLYHLAFLNKKFIEAKIDTDSNRYTKSTINRLLTKFNDVYKMKNYFRELLGYKDNFCAYHTKLEIIYFYIFCTNTLKIVNFETRKIIEHLDLRNKTNLTREVYFEPAYPVSLYNFKNIDTLFVNGIKADNLNISFEKLSNFKAIKINNCFIKYCEEISSYLFKSNKVVGYKLNITHLDLSFNNLNTINCNMAQTVPFCRVLILRSNQIASIPESLSYLEYLKDLDLSHNEISSVRKIELKIGSVEILNFSHNKIKEVYGLHRLWALKELYIEHNLINDVEEFYRLNTLPFLQKLSISGNKFEKTYDSNRFSFVGTNKSLDKYRLSIFRNFKNSSTRDVSVFELELNGSTPTNNEKQCLVSHQTNPAIRGIHVKNLSKESLMKDLSYSKINKPIIKLQPITSKTKKTKNIKDLIPLKNTYDDENTEISPAKSNLEQEDKEYSIKDNEEPVLDVENKNFLFKDTTQLHLVSSEERKNDKKKKADSNLILYKEVIKNSLFKLVCDYSFCKVNVRQNRDGIDGCKLKFETKGQVLLLGFDDKIIYLDSMSLVLFEVIDFRNLLFYKVDPQRKNFCIDRLNVHLVYQHPNETYKSITNLLIKRNTSTDVLLLGENEKTNKSVLMFLNILSICLVNNLENGAIGSSVGIDKCLTCDKYQFNIDEPLILYFNNITVDKYNSKNQNSCKACFKCGSTYMSSSNTKINNFEDQGYNIVVEKYKIYKFTLHYLLDVDFFERYTEYFKSTELFFGLSTIENSIPLNTYIASWYIKDHKRLSMFVSSISQKTKINDKKFVDKSKNSYKIKQINCNEIGSMKACMENSSCPLPFSKLTDELKIYLELQFFDDKNPEELYSWINVFILKQPRYARSKSLDKKTNKEHSFSIIDNLEESISTCYKTGYLLLTSKKIYIFEIDLGNLKQAFESQDLVHIIKDNHNCNLINKQPKTFLRLSQTIGFNRIKRIDVGPSRQYFALHLNIISKKDFNKNHKTPKASIISKFYHTDDSNTIVCLTQDKIKSTEFLDSLMIIRYKNKENSGKKNSDNLNIRAHCVNHNILWSIVNMRNSVFYSGEANDKHNPRDSCLRSEVNLDKVTFEFLKLYNVIHNATFEKEPNKITIRQLTLISTSDYLYLVKERHNYWPPNIIEINPNEYVDSNDDLKTFEHDLDVEEQYELSDKIRYTNIIQIEFYYLKRPITTKMCDHDRCTHNIRSFESMIKIEYKIPKGENISKKEWILMYTSTQMAEETLEIIKSICDSNRNAHGVVVFSNAEV